MLSAATLLFSSCLGDSEYTPTIGCTGVPYSYGARVRLDNGVIVNLSGFSSTDLLGVDRVYIYGQLSGDDADLEQLEVGQEVTVVPQMAIELELLEDITDYGDTMEDAFTGCNLSDVSSMSWFTMNNIFNALNGYMNFTLIGDCYSQTSSSSSTTTLVSPNFYVYVDNIDTQSNSVDLYIGFDNRESECVGDDGEVNDGYNYNQNVSFYLSFDTTYLYYQLDDLSDDDSITFNIYKVEKADDGTIEASKVSSSWQYTSIQKSYLNRSYYSY